MSTAVANVSRRHLPVATLASACLHAPGKMRQRSDRTTFREERAQGVQRRSLDSPPKVSGRFASKASADGSIWPHTVRQSRRSADLVRQ